MEIALVALCLGLTFMGFIQKSTPLLLATTLAWIVFGFYMFSVAFTNSYLNTALLMFGGAMALICAFKTLDVYTTSQRERPQIDEQEEYRRRIQDIVRKGK